MDETNNINNLSEIDQQMESIINEIDLSSNSYRNILKSFGIFQIINEKDVEILKEILKDKHEISLFLVNKLSLNPNLFKDLTKIEIFILTMIFSVDAKLEVNEICCLFSIIWDVLSLNLHKNSKLKIYNQFKEAVIKFSVDRPPFQIGIFSRNSYKLIMNFFFETIYNKYELLVYLTTNKKLIELSNSTIFNYSLPPTMSIDYGEEVLPRQVKVLKYYIEAKKPKSELEQKIDKVLDFERERLDKILQVKFNEQDEIFNKKLEEIVLKKKK